MGWLDGYDQADDDDRDEAEPEAAAPAPPASLGAVLACGHCGSDRIGPRSSSGGTDAVKFVCGVCGRTTTHRLAYGYRKVYRENLTMD